MSIVWSYWELKPGTCQNKIAYYDLIWRTVLNRLDPKTQFVLLTPQNIGQYLDLYHPMCSEVPHIAQRVDYLRVAILYHYGGLWIDLDTLVLRDLEYFLHLGKTYPFIAVNYSVDRFNHSRYLWVHDPLMYSDKGGKVISSFYQFFNEYFDQCQTGAHDIRQMSYDMSSRLLTHSLKANDKSSYFLLPHNCLDKIPQHVAHLWFKPLSRLNSSEREILQEYAEWGKLNICGSAHLNIFLQQYKKMSLDAVSNDEFLEYLYDTPLGYLLQRAGVGVDVDRYQFSYRGLTGLVCPYRRLILVDPAGSERETRDRVRDAFFYHRSQRLDYSLEDRDLSSYTVLLPFEGGDRWHQVSESTETVFSQPVRAFYGFSIDNLRLAVSRVAELTRSITVVDPATLPDPTIESAEHLIQLLEMSPLRPDASFIAPARNIPETVEEQWIQSLDLPYLKAEQDYLDNQAQRFKWGDNWLVVYHTFSAGWFLAAVTADRKLLNHWHLANLIAENEPDRFIYSNRHLQLQGRISCNNDVWTDRVVEVKSDTADSFTVLLDLVFDRYLKRSRYDGYYRRFRLRYQLEYDGDNWKIQNI